MPVDKALQVRLRPSFWMGWEPLGGLEMRSDVFWPESQQDPSAAVSKTEKVKAQTSSCDPAGQR